MKRSLSILLSLLLLFSLLPVSALAESEAENSSGNSAAIQSGTLQMRYNGGEWSTVYQLSADTHMVELRLLQENGSDYCLTGKDMDHVTYGGAVKSVTYTPIPISQDFTIPFWTLNIEGKVDSEGYVQYGESKVIITVVAKSQPPQGGEEGGNDRPPTGMLRLQYGEDSYITGDTIRLPAGWNNEVILTVFGNNWEAINSGLSCDQTVVKSLTSVSGENGVWRVIVSETSAVGATGWIQYGSDVNNRINVTIITPPHGGKVTEEDRVNPTDPPLVTPFEWNGKTYYLSLAGWEDDPAKLVPVGGRGRTVSDGSGPWLLSARVFDCISGTPNQNGAVYRNNDTVYQEMYTAGWQFIIELHPTDVGCEYYPVQEHKGDWYEYDINEYSVGRWIFEAKIVKFGEDGNITETLATNCCRHFYRLEKGILTDIPAGSNADTINQEICKAVGIPVTAEDTLFVNNYVFFLPAGEITGQLHIPAIGALDSVTLVGKYPEDGYTILRGGISIDANSCYVKNIRFIGAGKDAAVQGENNIPNCAIYGNGQGVYENCVFEGFYYALHGENRIAWGGTGSTFQNNHIAIYIEKALQGGNLDMDHNWFIGNDIAIQVDAFGEDLPVSQLTMRYDRFINNGVDMVNNSGVILWMSRNYFYRGEPVNGTWPAYGGSNSNYIAYMPYLPMMGGTTPTFAYPLARNTDCTAYFYPVFWGQNRHPGWWGRYCPNWWGMDRYPSFVRGDDRMPEGELDGTHIGFFDGEQVVGSFDFGSSQEGER